MKLLIFGTGRFFEKRKQFLKRNSIVGFIDNDCSKWGKTIDGITVYKPEQALLLEFDKVILMSAKAGEMKDQLLKKTEIEENKILFWEEFQGMEEKGHLELYSADRCDFYCKKEKVLIIAPRLDYTGGPITAVYAAMALFSKGYQVCLAAPEGKREFIREVNTMGIDVFLYKNLSFATWSELSWIEPFQIVIVNTLLLIHCAELINKEKPLFWWLHESRDVYDDMRDLGSLKLKSDVNDIRICAVSQIAKKNFENHMPARHITILPYGIPDKEAQVTAKGKKTMVIAMIGTVMKLKGQDVFLEAVSQLEIDASMQVEFWVIGDLNRGNIYAEDILNASEKIPHISLKGRMTREELEQAYQEINVVVCASREETMSMTITEGMMFGKICVTSDATGIARFIQDGENGFVFEAGNSTDLRHKLDSIINNRFDLNQIGKNARNTYLKNFTMEKFGNQLDQILQDVSHSYNPRFFNLNAVNKLQNKKIVIYGAGIYGTALFSFLKMRGLKDNVVCFVESEGKENQEHILGKPVLQFEDICIDNMTIIIVAMSKKNAGVLIDKLKQQRIINLYWFSKDSFEDVKREMKWEVFKKYSKYPIQKNKIFFYCYDGMGYRCNCKYIAEKLLDENYPVKLVWALTNMEDASNMPESIKTVKTNTEEYYKELYTSSVIIENSGRDSWVYKREGQFCINTWHGYGPFKKVHAAVSENDAEIIKDIFSYYDLFLSASKFYTQVYRTSFCYEGEVLECGAPRNDIFFTQKYRKETIYHLYGIPLDKKILLFAPTFRNDNAAAFDQYHLDMNQVLRGLKSRFGEDFVLMYRFHHKLYEAKERTHYKDGIDVTLYPDIQELLVAAEVVITDYSSLMWDFSLKRKPVFLYQCDAEEYEDHRGFYVPVSEWPYPQAHTQKELLEMIEHFDYETYVRELNLFLEQYGSCDDGHAAERVVKRIMYVVEQERIGDDG